MRDMRDDLQARLEKAYEEGACLVPDSPQDSQRLRRALKRGDVVSPAPCIYALPDHWNKLNPRKKEFYKVRALSKLHPDWVFAGVSAAVMHGLSVSYHMFGKTHLATSARAHSRSNAAFMRSRVSDDEFVRVDGVWVTSFQRTVFDCTRNAYFCDGLATADSALRISGLSRDDMYAVLENMSLRYANARRSLAIMKWADGRAENGGESYARAVMISQGFKLPDLQVYIDDLTDTLKSYRVDFFWKLHEGDVVGELDGKEKYCDPQMTNGRDIVDVMSDERLRESRITCTKTRVLRFSFADVKNTRRFCHLLTSFGVPDGYPVPAIART